MIWGDINRPEYLQMTLHQNDMSPRLDMAAANTCKNIWRFLVCLRSRIAKKFKWPLCSLIHVGLGILLCLMNEDHSILTVKLVTGLEWHAALADPKFVPKVYGPHPHAPYRANIKQISVFFLPVLGRLMFELHMQAALERRIGQLFLFGSLA